MLIEVMLLISVGTIFIYSASAIYAWKNIGDSLYFLKKHVIFILIGVVLMAIAMAIDLKRLERYAKPIIICAIVLLVLVLIPGIGKEISGARRWFRLFGWSFQPSEFAQLALIIYLAGFLSKKDKLINNFINGLLPVLLIVGLVSLLILMQPDLGSVIAINMVALIILFVAGMEKRYVAFLFILAVPLLYFLIFSIPYRRMRIMAFLNPWADPKGSGFQIIQSQIALGSGRLFGVGLGQSQQKLFYLPAAHTDFIFSIIGEELGILGTLGVTLLFINFVLDGFRVSISAQDKFSYFLSFGLITLLSLKVLINICVSIGIFPTKGLPLPFISYGGTSLVFDMISVGILLNISRSSDNI